MSLRIVIYYIKERWYIIVGLPGFGFFMAMLVYAIFPEVGVKFSVFLAMSAAIALSVLLASELSRSEIDFVFSTPVDPRFIFTWTFLVDWFFYSLGLTPIALYAAPPQKPTDLHPFIASLVVSAATLGVFVRVLSFFRFETYMAWLAVPIAAALLTCQLVHPDPYWIAITSLIVTLVHLSLQEYYTELYTNAYGLLGRLLPRPRPAEAPAVAPGPMPRSLWQLAWRTTYSGGRKRALAVAASISAAGAAAYLSIVFLLHVDSQGLALATLVSAFYLFLLLWDWHSFGLPLERLWISFSADYYAYVRWRTVARSLASLLATSPWIFAYALASLRYPPAAYMAASLVSASLTFPVLAWLIGALLGVPQIREYGLSQRPARYQSLLAFLPMGIVILYLLLARFWLYMLIFSVAFFCIALLWRGLWDWLVYRLAEVGYV